MLAVTRRDRLKLADCIDGKLEVTEKEGGKGRKKRRGNGDNGEAKMMIKNGDVDADQPRKRGRECGQGREEKLPEKKIQRKGQRKRKKKMRLFSLKLFFFI